MLMNHNFLIRASALAVLAVAASGCVALALGAGAAYGTIKYVENEAVRDFKQPLAEVWSASVASMRDQGFMVAEDSQPGGTEGVLKSGDAWVKVESHPGEMTRVRVRVGTFDNSDNRRRSTLLLEAIAKRLGEPPAESAS